MPLVFHTSAVRPQACLERGSRAGEEEWGRRGRTARLAPLCFLAATGGLLGGRLPPPRGQ